MHPFEYSLALQLRRDTLLSESRQARLLAGAAPRPRAPLAYRVAAVRQALGYLLVEAGLRLAVGRVAHSPPRAPAGT